jgi:hypothetical protein
MTVKDAIISELGFAPGNSNLVDKAILDNTLTGADTYDSAKETGVKKAALQICRVLLTTADVTNSNNAGFVSSQIKYDRAAVKARISQLEADLGINVQTPYITSRSVW